MSGGLRTDSLGAVRGGDPAAIGMTMAELALTHCWFTREHRPATTGRSREGAIRHGHCRYCLRPIFTHDGRIWHLDGGFNLEELLETIPAFLSVEDTDEGVVIARYAIPAEASEEDIEALCLHIAELHDLSEGSGLALRDSRGKRHPLHPRGKRPAAGKAAPRPASDDLNENAIDPIPAAAAPPPEAPRAQP